MSEKLVFTREYFPYLLGTSWCGFMAGLVAFMNGHYKLLHIPFGLWATSILYWHHPTRTWRRVLDILYVQYTFWYMLYMAWGSQYAIPYYMLIVLGAPCHPISSYYYAKEQYAESVFFHGMLHIFASSANIILYSGRIGAKPALGIPTIFS
jgi:hypothetical protein